MEEPRRPKPKPVYWRGTSRADLRAFPEEARHEAGAQLWSVQCGEPPDDFKYLGEIGSGVYEIRIRTQVEHRVFYIAKFAEAVYVLHAFEKRTRKTNTRDLEIARRRYNELVRERRH